MAKVTVQLEDDTIDKIVLDELKWCLQSLKTDLRNRKANRGIAVFDMDRKEDIKALKEHINAFKLVIQYHSVSGQEE